MRRLSHCVTLLSALACLLTAGALPLRAERLIFQRGDALYAAATDGRDTRRLFTIGKPLEVVWAVSGDGRRIAWFAPSAGKGGARTASLKVRPIAVYVADLSGQRKKRLFSTDSLRDRQGRPVTQLGVGTAVASAAAAAAREGSGSFEDWTPDSLAWSADGKSLYLSCTLQSARGGRATFVADSATGAVVVDAAQRWKSITPMTQVDARGPLLAGVGLAYPAGAAQAPELATRFYPILVTNLAEGKTTSLFPVARNRPLYAAALAPALAPDGKSLAFATVGAGLWHVDIQGKTYRRLTRNPADDAPRWSLDGKRLLFLSARFEANDLYEITLAAPAKRRVLLPKVERFSLVPD